MDIKEELLHPEGIFSTPKEVLDHLELTKEQKIEVLRSWVYEANECTAAENEGMVVRGEPIHLDAVHAALHELTGKNG